MNASPLPASSLLHCQVMPDRRALLETFPKKGVYAELGVDEGVFSKMLFEICQPETLHLVDIWGDSRYHDSKRRAVEKLFREAIDRKTVIIHHTSSIQAADSFEDDFFDCVYIDTDHSYETTLSELRAYASKVKPGGYLAGHDYIQGNWIDMQRYGVREAVSQFLSEQTDWVFAFITMEVTEPPSFALKKLKD